MAGTIRIHELNSNTVADITTDKNTSYLLVESNLLSKKLSIGDLLSQTIGDDHVHVIDDVTNLTTSDTNITGGWSFTTPSFNLVDLVNMTGTVNLDLSLGCFFKGVITGNTTITLSGTLVGSSVKNIGLVITNGGSGVITWPAAFKWGGGTLPTLTTVGVDIITFMTMDNGATWYNFGQVLDIK